MNLVHSTGRRCCAGPDCEMTRAALVTPSSPRWRSPPGTEPAASVRPRRTRRARRVGPRSGAHAPFVGSVSVGIELLEPATAPVAGGRGVTTRVALGDPAEQLAPVAVSTRCELVIAAGARCRSQTHGASRNAASGRSELPPPLPAPSVERLAPMSAVQKRPRAPRPRSQTGRSRRLPTAILPTTDARARPAPSPRMRAGPVVRGGQPTVPLAPIVHRREHAFA